MKKSNFSSIVMPIFIIISPLLDNFTYLFGNILGFNVPLLTFLKPILLGIIFLYLIVLLIKNKKNIFPYMIIVFLYLIYAVCHLTLINDKFLEISNGNFYEEFTRLIQFLCLIVTLLIMIILMKHKDIFNFNKDLILKSLIISAIIYYGMYLLSILTSTSPLTYGNNSPNIGYKGWLEPAHLINHFGVLVSPICWYEFIKEKKYRYLFMFLLITLPCFFLGGTKSATLGIICVYLLIFGIEFLNLIFSKERGKKTFIISLLILVFSLVSYNYTYTSFNVKNLNKIYSDFNNKQSDTLNNAIEQVELEKNNQINNSEQSQDVVQNVNSETEEYMHNVTDSLNYLKNRIKIGLSETNNRQNQLIYNAKLFELSSLKYKLLGTGFYVQPNNLYMKDDFFSVLFNFGIFGFILTLIPLIIIYLFCFFKILIKFIKLRFNDIYHEIILFISTSLFIVLIFTTGYLLSQPSLIILYVPIFYILYDALIQKKDNILIVPRLKKYISRLFRMKNKSEYKKEIQKRKNLSVFDYENLSKELCENYKELSKDNTLYGISNSLRKYTSYTNIVDIYIEHGVNFTDSVPSKSILGGLNSVLTFSDLRKKIIEEKTNKNTIPIGPYIHYVQDLYDEEYFDNEKKKLGKTLLVFPSHSIPGVNYKYDEKKFINEIERVKKKYKFNTVIVCFYYLDILNNKHIAFKKMGYKIATAGHKYDEMFLPRLKYIIKLSDYTMSNNIGTHIGYCIYLGKPHYLYEQKVDINGEKYEKEFKNRMSSYISACEELYSCFNKCTKQITNEQYELYEKYWGASCIKTKQELYNILKNDD